MIEKLLEGKLNLYSEQGMEGGYLSIQNKEYINFKTPIFGITDNMKVWDKNNTSRFGMTSKPEIYLNNTWLPWPDPIYQDPDFRISSLNLDKVGNLKADKRISERYNIKIKYVGDILNEKFGENNWIYKTSTKSEIILNNGEVMHIGYSPTSEPNRPYSLQQGALTRVTIKWNDGTTEAKVKSDRLLIKQWNLDGLNTLKGTDIIKVIDPISKTVFCESQIDLIPLKIFSQTAEGHFEQINQSLNEATNWTKYFTEQYSAELHRETTTSNN